MYLQNKTSYFFCLRCQCEKKPAESGGETEPGFTKREGHVPRHVSLQCEEQRWRRDEPNPQSQWRSFSRPAQRTKRSLKLRDSVQPQLMTNQLQNVHTSWLMLPFQCWWGECRKVRIENYTEYWEAVKMKRSMSLLKIERRGWGCWFPSNTDAKLYLVWIFHRNASEN